MQRRPRTRHSLTNKVTCARAQSPTINPGLPYRKGIYLFACCVIFMLIFRMTIFFQNHLFQNILSGILSECQTVWIQIRPDNMSGLSESGYQRTALRCRTEQNRTVSLLISGHIHDIEIQCEQQNVIYKGLGIFFSLLNTELLYR